MLMLALSGGSKVTMPDGPDDSDALAPFRAPSGRPWSGGGREDLAAALRRLMELTVTSTPAPGAFADAGEDAAAAAENAIRKRDPEFSREALAERISGGFVQIQEAWSGQDMRPVRHLVSDGVFERFSL